MMIAAAVNLTRLESEAVTSYLYPQRERGENTHWFISPEPVRYVYQNKHIITHECFFAHVEQPIDIYRT